MALPVPDHQICVPRAREQLPRHIRQLLMTRLRLAQELPDHRSAAEHRRLYLICQAMCWLVLPALLILVAAIGFYTQPVQESPPPGSFSGLLGRLALVQTIGFLLTHAVRHPIRQWGWKQLAWRALLPRLLGTAFVLSCISASGSLAVDTLVGRQPWDNKYSLGMMYLHHWLQGFFIFTPWLFIYFIYHQSDRLARSEFERLRLAATAKEAELRALKSQVNPHFIFNSLNSLRALIEEDPARARGAVTQLAGLLRYALQSGQHETVPLQEELRIVNDYLALEQVRFEDRLRVRLDAAPDTLALPVPPLLLQTLVENAVKYGIAPRPEGGEVAIRTWCEGGMLHLKVSNPGEMPPDPAENPPARWSSMTGQDGAAKPVVLGHPTDSTGMGIKNAAERLRLLYGERATLSVGCTAPGLVVAEAIFPLSDPS